MALPYPNLPAEIHPRPLFKRDACSDVFGANHSNSICSPSFTLCCVERGQRFPSCQQHLDKGWCCVSSNPHDNCYVDQASACDEPNSVPCTNLAPGTPKACCPPLTSCEPRTEASKDHVRCNIRYADLRAAAGDPFEEPASSSSPSSSSTSTTTSTTTISLPSSAANADSAQTTGVPPSLSAETYPEAGAAALSAGLIAGTAIGATLAFVSLLILGYLFFRRRAKARKAAAIGVGVDAGQQQQYQHQQSGGYPTYPPHRPSPPPFAGYHQPVYYYQGQDYARAKPEVGGYGSWHEPAELGTER